MRKFLYVVRALVIVCFTAFVLSAQAKNEAKNNNAQHVSNKTIKPSTSPLWLPLIEKNDLSQWKIIGGSSTYHIEDNTVIGTSVASKMNTFLVSNKVYSDFIFETDVKADTHINSGIQFRSNLNKKSHVYGYQMEIDTSERAWSGGIFD